MVGVVIPALPVGEDLGMNILPDLEVTWGGEMTAVILTSGFAF